MVTTDLGQHLHPVAGRVVEAQKPEPDSVITLLLCMVEKIAKSMDPKRRLFHVTYMNVQVEISLLRKQIRANKQPILFNKAEVKMAFRKIVLCLT